MTFLGAAVEAALHRLRHSDGLRQREADRRVDVDAASRRLLDGDDAGGGRRDLDLDVRRETVKMNRLFHQLGEIHVVDWIGLHGETPLEMPLPLENWQQHLGAAHPHLLDELPSDHVFGRRRVLGDQLPKPALPGLEFLAEDRENDGRVGRRANCAIADCVFELPRGARVVPDIGWAVMHRSVQRRRVGGRNVHGSPLLHRSRRISRPFSAPVAIIRLERSTT